MKQSKELEIIINITKDKIDEVLSVLTEQEEKVLRLRFGLEDGKAKLLIEVGTMLGISKEEVKKIELKALRKLANGVKQFDNNFIKEIKPHYDLLNEDEKTEFLNKEGKLIPIDKIRKLDKRISK